MNPGTTADEPNPVAVNPTVTNAAPKPAAAPIPGSMPIPVAPKVPQLKPDHLTPEGFEDVPLPNDGFKRRRIGTEKWRHHCSCGPRLQYCKRGCKGIRQQQKTTPEGFEDIPLETGGEPRGASPSSSEHPPPTLPHARVPPPAPLHKLCTALKRGTFASILPRDPAKPHPTQCWPRFQAAAYR